MQLDIYLPYLEPESDRPEFQKKRGYEFVAQAYFELGEKDNAFKYINLALEKWPEIHFYKIRGIFYERLGNYESALKDYYHSNYAKGICRANIRNKNYHFPIQDKTRDSFFKFITTNSMKSYFYIKKGEIDNAIACYSKEDKDKYVKLRNLNGLYYQLSILSNLSGRPDLSLQFQKLIINYDPFFAPVYMIRSYSYYLMNNKAEMCSNLNEAYRLGLRMDKEIRIKDCN